MTSYETRGEKVEIYDYSKNILLSLHNVRICSNNDRAKKRWPTRFTAHHNLISVFNGTQYFTCMSCSYCCMCTKWKLSGGEHGIPNWKYVWSVMNCVVSFKKSDKNKHSKTFTREMQNGKYNRWKEPIVIFGWASIHRSHCVYVLQWADSPHQIVLQARDQSTNAYSDR